MFTASIRVAAFGDVEIDVDVSFDNDDWDVESMSIAGMYFEWQDVTYNGEPLIDYLSPMIVEQIDDLGWERGAAACERADNMRKEP